MDIVIFSTALVAVVIGLTEVVKRASAVGDRWVPLIALSLGIGGSLLGNAALLVVPPVVPAAAVWYGIIAGLSASGLYSSTKTLTQS